MNYDWTAQINSIFLPLVLPLLEGQYTKDKIMVMTYKEVRDLAVVEIERLKRNDPARGT